jgi:hypothetical protein
LLFIFFLQLKSDEGGVLVLVLGFICIRALCEMFTLFTVHDYIYFYSLGLGCLCFRFGDADLPDASIKFWFDM